MNPTARSDVVPQAPVSRYPRILRENLLTPRARYETPWTGRGILINESATCIPLSVTVNPRMSNRLLLHTGIHYIQQGDLQWLAI